jgi:hypothetical protein
MSKKILFTPYQMFKTEPAQETVIILVDVSESTKNLFVKNYSYY